MGPLLRVGHDAPLIALPQINAYPAIPKLEDANRDLGMTLRRDDPLDRRKHNVHNFAKQYALQNLSPPCQGRQ